MGGVGGLLALTLLMSVTGCSLWVSSLKVSSLLGPIACCIRMMENNRLYATPFYLLVCWQRESQPAGVQQMVASHGHSEHIKSTHMSLPAPVGASEGGAAARECRHTCRLAVPGIAGTAWF